MIRSQDTPSIEGPRSLSGITRRRFLTATGSMLLFGAAGCGGGGAAGDRGSGGSRNTRTIEHRYGSTKVSGRPERVVTVGWIEQDAVLALGIVPLATTEWVGGYPGAIFPWAQDKLGDAETPEALDNINGIKFESIAALEPDIILALYTDMPRQGYETLSRIAPTIAQPKEDDDFSVSWQKLTRTVGLALGSADEAEQLVEDVEAKFIGVREAHPAFVGATALNAYPQSGDVFIAYPPPDLGGRLLADLGFEVPQDIVEIANGKSSVTISGEQLDLFDTDVLVWLVDNEAHRDNVRNNPLYAKLNVATQRRDIFLDYATDPLAEATSVQTVLSLPFLLDGLVPQLAAAIDGDPKTTTTGS